MASATLFRLSGLALLVAWPLQILGWLMHPTGERLVDLLSPLQGPSHLVMFVSWMFALVGLPGLYARQAHRAGLLGLIAFSLTVLVAVYHGYLLLYEAYPAVLMANHEETRDLIVTGGSLAHGAGALEPFASALLLAIALFGIVVVRAGVVPRWSGWLQIVCVPVGVAGLILLTMIWGEDGLYRLPGPAQPIALLYYLLFAGYAGGGYVLWRGIEHRQEAAAQTGVPQPTA